MNTMAEFNFRPPILLVFPDELQAMPARHAEPRKRVFHDRLFAIDP
jgi:hypothetical protein